ncbi:MAG: alpha/beta hydrolase-fold protein, partial [Mycobacterium sp.]
DIPVAFLAGGPHAVYLLDPFDAAPDVSNWVTAGNAMNTLAGKGISVVAPAGGAYSMYTNWEQDVSKQWDTFLSSELPNWLAANKGLAPGGHAAVGASQGGYAAMALAAFHPDRFGFAGSLSGFLYPSSTNYNGAILAGLQQFGGVDGNGMWGAPQLGRWKWHDPYVHASLLAQNNTRVWVYSPTNDGASDPAAMIGQAGSAMGSAREFYQQYRSNGGHNGHFDFPGGGDNGWGSWAPQLGAMSGDIVGAIR